MTENSKESQKAQEKKNVFSKIKETIDDKEEQLEILGTFIRLGVMVWAGFIISLNYVSNCFLTKLKTGSCFYRAPNNFEILNV